jgi:hypothetical protein
LDYREEPVELPDPEQPVCVVRDLTLLRNKKDPIVIRSITLIILINRCLYLVCEDGYGLKAGQVLWRDLELTKRRGGLRADPASEQFKAYDGLNHARRAATLIEPSYRELENPDLRQWIALLDEMMRTSWTLHQVGEEEQQKYERMADTVVSDHAGVCNEHKVKALGHTRQAGSLMDRLGRPNPGRIPLITMAGENALRRRLSGMRAKGFRMGWRQIVLEHYIDRLREITITLSRSAHHRLTCKILFGKQRTPRKIKEVARGMRGTAKKLMTLIGRPFSHTFIHVANDLEACAQIMDCVVERVRSGNTEDARILIAEVKPILGKIYRSAQLRQFHWRLEEIMVSTTRARITGKNASDSEIQEWHQELCRCHRQLSRKDPVTQQRWDEGFNRGFVRGVFSQVFLADRCLMRPASQGGPDFQQMHEHLKSACKRF